MKLELRSISLWSFIKISVFVNLILGFVGGLFYALFLSMFLSAFSGLAEMGFPDLQDADMPLGFLLIAMPIMCSLGAAFFGTLWGIVCLLTYNLVTMLTGGLQINVDDVTVVDAGQPPVPIMGQTGASAAHGQPSAAPPPPPPPPPPMAQGADEGLPPPPPASPAAATSSSPTDVEKNQPSAAAADTRFRPPEPLNLNDDDPKPSS